MRVQIRWLIRRDMPEVLAIENDCYPHPWTEEQFLHCLRQRNCIGMVAEHNHEIVGFMVYELHRKHIHLLNIAVALSAHRHGVGRQMVDRLKDKLIKRRATLELTCSEKNLVAQLFFKSQGFKAVEVLPEFYEATNDAAYVMHYRLEPDVHPYHPSNRMKDYFETLDTI